MGREDPGTCRYLSKLTTPTDEELWTHSRVPRLKSAGCDGYAPYLLYLLDRKRFHLVGNCVRSILRDGVIPEGFADAKVVGLYKGSGSWEISSSWRPICMPTAL